MDTQLVISISSFFTAFGVVFMAWQAYLSSKHLKILKKRIIQDHQLSRRQKALEVIEKFNKTLDRAHPSARNVIEGLSIEKCLSIKNKAPIQISSTKLPFLKDALKGYIEEGELEADINEKINLNVKHVSQLHYLAVSHLNALEIALLAWHNGIADKDILETQLQYLVRPDSSYYVLANYREAMGGDSTYPAISAFVKHIKEKLKRPIAEAKDELA